jgi:hypothetical protein
LIESPYLIIFNFMGRKVCFFAGLFLALALPGLIFFLRSPVLIVTDTSFLSLYGSRRVWERQAAASIRLFRRVKPVIVAESAGTDVFVFAVEEAASRPYCVIFPSRYYEGALRYAGQFPRIPVLSLGSGPGVSRPGAGRLVSAGILREADLYRAGRCAGIFAQKARETGGPDNGENILVLPGQRLSSAERNALLAGLREQEIETAPWFLNSSAEAAGLRGVSCVILAGPAAEYLEKNLKNPVILFSWLDPALTSRETVMIFDDSPWALAVPAVKLAVRGEEGANIPSEAVFPRGRIADKELSRKVKKAARDVAP